MTEGKDYNTNYQILNVIENSEHDQSHPDRTNCMKNFPKCFGMNENEKF